MTWRPIDLREDPGEVRFAQDPGTLIDAAAAIEELVHRPAWMADAACREHPELSWFPARGESIEEARHVCAGCLVAEDCRTYALEQPPWLSGLWGGTSERERRRGRAGHQEAA